MERTSSATEHCICMPDDTVLILQKFDAGKQDAILVIPDVTQPSNESQKLVSALLFHGNVYLLELRGHGVSEGRWSSQKQQDDIEYVAELLKKRYRTFIVASGINATILLNLEHKLTVDGIIVVSPTTRKGKISIKYLPARVQTPTAVVNAGTMTNIFGNVRFYTGEHLQLLTAICTALMNMKREELPIRVRLSRNLKGILQ